MLKIADHFEIKEVKDIVIRLGDLNLVFDMNSGDIELNKRLFQDFPFTEANLIGVQILNSSKQLVLDKKRERQSEERKLKK